MSVSVEMREVVFGYRLHRPPVLTAVTLDVPAAGVLTVLGPSGSGKSTLLALLAGLETPWAGTIHFAGVDITSTPPADRDVAMVLQRPYLFPNLSVGENVAFGLAARGLPRRDRVGQAERWLARVGLDGMASRDPRELSGGEQQRVSLVRALAINPRLLLLDEPFASLDPLVRDEMQTLVREIIVEAGLTAVLVTHDLAEAMGLGDQTALFDGGRVVAHAPSRELYERPPTRTAARALGVTTFFTGHASGDVVATPVGPLGVSGLSRHGAIVCAIRPERTRLTDGPGPNAFAGRVLASIYRGDHWDVSVQSAIGTVRVRSPEAYVTDASCHVVLPADAIFAVDDV